MRLIFLLLLLPTSLLWAQSRNLVIRQANVVDMAIGAIHTNTNVLIRGDRIIAVGTHIKPSLGDTVVEAHGQYLMPGLWDMHVHIRNEENIFFPLLIANGVTGIRDM